MARPGVTYQDVNQAAQELVANGKVPTVENVRIMLGTGSHSTLAAHLRQWKANQDASQQLASKEKLPAELIVIIKDLWQRVMQQADEKIQLIQAENEQIRAALTHEIQCLQQDKAHWQQQHAELKQEKENSVNENVMLNQAIHRLQEEKIRSTAKGEHLCHQLGEQRHRIEELKQLNQQGQQNLEHYREATREQRLRESAQYEAIQTQSEQAINQLKQALAKATQQNNKQAKEIDVLSYAKETLQQRCTQQVTSIEKHQSALENLNKKMARLAQAEIHWKNEYTLCHKSATELNVTLLALQTQQAVLFQQQADNKKQLDDLKQENKALARDKWLLALEKVQLEGQLQQLEKATV